MGHDRMPSLLPLSLYVHYPWCVRKCPYCDFNSRKKPVEEGLDGQYLRSLLDDFSKVSHYIQGRKLTSVYFGGGTPSLFNPHHMECLLETLDGYIDLHTEISMESNPGTVDIASLSAYRAIGINRLSIGVQSFNDVSLKRLGRIHDAKTALAACEAAHNAQFDNINIDLIHGLPQQSPAEAMQDLAMAVKMGTNHLSWYELTIEEGTAFGRKPPQLPDEDTLSEIETEGFSYLEEQGFERYEVSGFTKDSRPCRHNLNYWRFGDYLGIGAGAHSKLFLNGKTMRRACPESPLDYMSGNYGSYRTVPPEELPFEFMLNRLRVFDRIGIGEFSKTTALPFEKVEAQLIKAKTLGLIEFEKECFYVTNFGKTMLNDVLTMFLE